MAEFIPYTTEQLLDLFKAAYFEITGQTLTIGSDEFAFSSAAAYVLRVFEQSLQHGADQININTASGAALDALATSFGISRPSPQKARIAVRLTTLRATSTFFLSTTPFASGGGVDWYLKTDLRFNFNNSQTYDFLIYAEEAGSSHNGVSGITFNETSDFYTLEQKTVSSGGTDSIDAYTPENDDIFREYIKTQLKALSVGTASYYEQQALKGNDDIIWSAYCLRDGDEGFEPGKVKINLSFNPQISSTVFQNAFINELNEYLNSDDVKCVTDFVQAQIIDYTPYPYESMNVCYKRRFSAISTNNLSFAEIHFGKCILKYNNYLRKHINAPFLLSELSEIFCTPDEEGVYAESILINDDYFLPAVGSYVQLNKPTFSQVNEWV